MELVKVRTLDGRYIDFSDRYDQHSKFSVSPEIIILSPSGDYPLLTDVLSRFPENLQGNEAVVFNSPSLWQSFRVPGRGDLPVSGFIQNRLSRVPQDWMVQEALSWRPNLGSPPHITDKCWSESESILRRVGLTEDVPGYFDLYSQIARILSRPGSPVVLELFADSLPSSQWPAALRALRQAMCPQFIAITRDLSCLGYLPTDSWKSVFVIDCDSGVIKPVTSIAGTIHSLRSAVLSSDPSSEVQNVVRNLTIKIQRLYGFSGPSLGNSDSFTS